MSTRIKGRDSVASDPRVIKHPSWEGDEFSLTEGDSVKAKVPGYGTLTICTFVAEVVPENGKPYIEVVDRMGHSRCLRHEAIIKKGK